MKKLTWLLFGSIILVLSMTQPVLQADTRQVVFFKETTCEECAKVEGFMDGVGQGYDETEDYIQIMEDMGITVIIYDIMLNPNVPEYRYENNDGELVEVSTLDVYFAFNEAYNRSSSLVPVIFVGNEYIFGADEIKARVDDNTVFDLSDDPMPEITVYEGQAIDQITGIVGFFVVLGAGLLDGFNPCAIALLLLFISLLGFTDNKKVLIYVSITYITALYLSYFLMGTLLLNFMNNYRSELVAIGDVFAWIIMTICLFLFVLNFYDYIQARKEQYGKFKSQLPKWIQKINKRILKVFTGAINAENNRGLIPVLSLTFVLGLILSLTELICTGGIYFVVLSSIHTLNTAHSLTLLIFYNLMFVLPLIIIAVISIRIRSVNSVSNWVREHMTLIKFFNATLFFVIFLYFLFQVL